MRKILSVAAFVAAMVLPSARLGEALAEPAPAPKAAPHNSSAAAAKPALPEVPAVLAELKPELTFNRGVLRISLHSEKPLTAEQWDAIAALHPREFAFGNRALDDAGMDRLAALDPIGVGLNMSILTGKGFSKFGKMSSLVALHTNHTITPTPEAKGAFAHHPSLESFATVGTFGVEALDAPKLKTVVLQHGAASDAIVARLANHPAVENLKLGEWGGSTLTDAAMPALASVKKLSHLNIYLTALSYDGLRHLKDLPNLATLDLIEVDLPEGDLEKLKAEQAKVKITWKPLTPENRDKRQKWLEKAKRDKAGAAPVEKDGRLVADKGNSPMLANPFFPFDSGVGRGKWTPQEQAQCVKDLGFDGIGYNYDPKNPELLDQWLTELHQRGLKLVDVYSGLRFPKKPGDRPNDFLQGPIRKLKGSETVLWVPIWGHPHDEPCDDEAVKMIGEVADWCQESRIKLCLYAHGGAYTNTADDCLRLAKKVNRPDVVGVSINLLHERSGGNTDRLTQLPADMGRYLFIVSINGSDSVKGGVLPLGKGGFDVYPFLKALRDAGYQGPIGIQCINRPGDTRENLVNDMAQWKAWNARLASDAVATEQTTPR